MLQGMVPIDISNELNGDMGGVKPESQFVGAPSALEMAPLHNQRPHFAGLRATPKISPTCPVP